MRRNARLAQSRTTTGPRPDALTKFLDRPFSFSQGAQNFGGEIPSPPFQPATTLRGGMGGGFGTGGGFGSTGGFHTKRLAPWEEPTIIKLDSAAPPLIDFVMPKEASRWAPSVCATAVAHTVNKIRAELEGGENLKAVVNESLVAPDIQPNDGGPMLVMKPERFAFHNVTVPPAEKVQPPESYGKPPDAFWTPEERRTLLEFEREKRLADTVLGRDRHRQMRMIALMQRRYPNGVVGVESAATEGTVVYAAARRADQLASHAARDHRARQVGWIVSNGRSEPHLGYDFLRTVPGDFLPLPGAPEQVLPITTAVNSAPDPWRTKRHGAPHIDTFQRTVAGGTPAAGAVAGVGFAGAAAPAAGTWPPPRTQEIRNRETDGRGYDIITGLLITNVPPTAPERVAVAAVSAECRRRMHPSLNPGSEPAHVTWT